MSLNMVRIVMDAGALNDAAGPELGIFSTFDRDLVPKNVLVEHGACRPRFSHAAATGMGEFGMVLLVVLIRRIKKSSKDSVA